LPARPTHPLTAEIGRAMIEEMGGRGMSNKHKSLSLIARRAGISVSFLSRMKRGERRPSVTTLIKLSKSLHMTTDNIIKWLGINGGNKRG